MTDMFEIHVRKNFSAAHSLRGYPGDCVRLHGHNWLVDVFVRCAELDAIGLGLDFREVKKALHDVLQELDHFNLNDVPAFQQVNPTSENVAKYLYEQLGAKLNSDVVRVAKVTVSETPDCSASYWEG